MATVARRRDQRQATRLNVTLPAQLRERGSTFRFHITVEDLSRLGLRCSSSEPLVPEQIVVILLAGLAPLEARVAWAQDACYGLAFGRPLHPSVFHHIASRHPAA